MTFIILTQLIKWCDGMLLNKLFISFSLLFQVLPSVPSCAGSWEGCQESARWKTPNWHSSITLVLVEPLLLLFIEWDFLTFTGDQSLYVCSFKSIWINVFAYHKGKYFCTVIFYDRYHNWCNKGHGMYYPVCGMMHIK